MSDFSETRRSTFWTNIYENETPRWDLGSPSPVLEAAVGLGVFERGGRILVPGCGNGHDAILLAQSGFRVTAVDFSEVPVRSLSERVHQLGLEMEVRQANIFDLSSEDAGAFDGVFEYTCYCAIDPAQRDDYRDLMSHLVRPGGALLMFAYPLDKQAPGPPHGIFLDELRARFDAAWHWRLDCESPLVPEHRRGAERVVLLSRR
ncbi:MAG: methyltransferase domain-containing protein [Myxococcales bacterium]|nr:methyltransferase domain-containing protein [Myxococcales bacterium]